MKNEEWNIWTSENKKFVQNFGWETSKKENTGIHDRLLDIVHCLGF
jgi:hypothetical protein